MLLLLYSISVYQDYFLMLQFTDRLNSLNHQAQKIYDLNVTLPSQISSKNYSDYYHFELGLAIIVVHCMVWYHLYNFNNMKNTHGGVLILVKLQA